MSIGIRSRRAAVLAAGVVAGASFATPAQSAVDTTPPTLSTPVKASFRVGQPIDVGAPLDCVDDPHDVRVHAVPMTFSWKGSDASGSVRYSLVGVTGAFGPEEVFVDSSQTSYSAAVGSNGSQDCGGGNRSVFEWDLTASDPSGNTVTNVLHGGRIRLTQDSNLADRAGYATQPTIAYAGGGWGVSRCACWSDRTVHRTSTKGASATITPQPFTGFPDLKNHHVGLVMHKGPDRGKFRVYVDGALRTTVDLYAPTSQPRMIVWQTAFRDYAHQVKLVNLATAGRPRIDLDAVLTN